MRSKKMYALVFPESAGFKVGFVIGASLVICYQVGKQVGKREERQRWQHIPYHRVAESVLGKRVVS